MVEDDFYGEEPASDPADDAPETLLWRLARFVRTYLRQPTEANKALLENELDYIEPLFETDDPVQNGWVGSDGRP